MDSQARHAGFTLIELMIVVAIIGILAAIAFPQYQAYIVRSKWSNNLQSIAVLKQAIAECLQNNAGAATSCDSDVKLISQGFVPPGYVLPVPPFATGPVAISVATAAIVMTGNSAAGGCLVTLEPSSGPMSRMVDWRFTNAGGCNRGSTGVGT